MKRVRILAGVFPETEAQLRECLTEQPDLDLVFCTRDGALALQAVADHAVDVILLELAMPNLDALAVLERLAGLPENRHPRVVVLTPTGSEAVIGWLMEAGAAYCLLKPVTASIICDRIRQLAQPNEPSRSWPREWGARTPTPEVAISDAMADPDAAIAQLVWRIGLNNRLCGYPYLCHAVRMVVEDESMLTGITKVLYPKIARLTGASASRVERSLRHAIKKVWSSGNTAELDTLFGPWRRAHRPTNSEFIAVLADQLRPHADGQ